MFFSVSASKCWHLGLCSLCLPVQISGTGGSYSARLWLKRQKIIILLQLLVLHLSLYALNFVYLKFREHHPCSFSVSTIPKSTQDGKCSFCLDGLKSPCKTCMLSVSVSQKTWERDSQDVLFSGSFLFLYMISTLGTQSTNSVFYVLFSVLMISKCYQDSGMFSLSTVSDPRSTRVYCLCLCLKNSLSNITCSVFQPLLLFSMSSASYTSKLQFTLACSFSVAATSKIRAASTQQPTRLCCARLCSSKSKT